MQSTKSLLPLLLFLRISSATLKCPSGISQTPLDIKLVTYDPVQRFAEISGTVISPNQVSPKNNSILFGISDGGSGSRVGVWDSETGERLLTLSLGEVINQDWEAMTIGSCGNTGINKSCLYILDGGDNRARNNGGKRSGRDGASYKILKMYEPDYRLFQDDDVFPSAYLSTLEYDYFHDSSPTSYADCETMFMDSITGNIYLVSKFGKDDADPSINPNTDDNDRFTKTRIFEILPQVFPNSMCNSVVSNYSVPVAGHYENTGTFSLVANNFLGMQWRSGEMTQDGSLIGLSTWNETRLFLRCPGKSVADTLLSNGTMCLQWPHPTIGGNQVESLAWTSTASKALTIAEGTRPYLGWTNLNYDESSSISCPMSFSVTNSPSNRNLPKLELVNMSQQALMSVECLAFVKENNQTESPSMAPSALQPTDFQSATSTPEDDSKSSTDQDDVDGQAKADINTYSSGNIIKPWWCRIILSFLPVFLRIWMDS
jgi:hypothetical protein